MAENEVPEGGLLAEREALVEVARALWAQLPDDCDRIRLEALSFADFSEHRKRAFNAEGERVIGASYPVVKALEKLRRVMYKPNTGTWFTATFDLVRPGKLETHFDYDNEPDWSVAPSDDTYRAEAEKFPRSPEHTPEWMRAKLG